MTRIMSGAYDAGFGDMNALIQNAAQRPGRGAGHGLHDLQQAPFALLTKARARSNRQGSGRPETRRAGWRRPRACSRCLPRRTGSIRNQVDVAQHGSRTCKSRCCCRARSTRPPSSPRQLHEFGRAAARTGQGFPLDLLRRLRLDLYSNGVMVSAKLAEESRKQ